MVSLPISDELLASCATDNSSSDQDIASVGSSQSDVEDEQCSSEIVSQIEMDDSEPYEHPVETLIGRRELQLSGKNSSRRFLSEYLAKYRYQSYAHCTWISERELFDMGHDKDARMKLTYWDKRETKFSAHKPDRSLHDGVLHPFSRLLVDIDVEDEISKQNKVNCEWGCDEDGFFFPSEWCEVDRVIAAEPVEGKFTETIDAIVDSDVRSKYSSNTRFLVKWRNLTYDQCTWELPNVLDDDPAIDRFYKYDTHPSDKEWLNHDSRKFTKEFERPYNNTGFKCPLFKGDNELRPYQLEGLNWLKLNYLMNRSCILADESEYRLENPQFTIF